MGLARIKQIEKNLENLDHLSKMIEMKNGYFEFGGFKCTPLLDSKNAQVFMIEGKGFMETHKHTKAYETFILLEGEITVKTNKKHIIQNCIPLQIKPETKHSVKATKKTKFLSILVPAENAYRSDIQRE